MGSVSPYETAAGRRYRVRYRKPDHSQTDKRGFRTKKEAELFLASVEVTKAQGLYIDPSRSRMTVGEWFDVWMLSRADLRATSMERLEGIVAGHIKPTLGSYALAALSHQDVQAWASTLSKTQGPASVKKIANTLSGALSAAVRDGRIPSNPATGLKLPKLASAQKVYLTHAEVADLAAAVDAIGNGREHGFGTLIRVLAYCGLRWGELSGLRVRDVDLVRGRLEVSHTIVEVGGVQHEQTPKDYEHRSIPVPATILEQLREHIEGRELDEPVFPGPRGNGWLRGRVFRRGWFNQAAAEIGYEGLTPHEMRHTAASLAISAGANVKAVQRMLGHASAAVTLEVYSGLFDSDLDNVSAALDDALQRAIVGKTWAATEKAGLRLVR